MLLKRRGDTRGGRRQADHVVGCRGVVPLQFLIITGQPLDHCHRYHATRAEPLRELGHFEQAQAVERRALELTAHPIEQSLLRQPILDSYSTLKYQGLRWS